MKMKLQLVPPHLHRTNVANCSITTFKDHFMAGLSSADPSFPMYLGCQPAPQATATLNLLSPSHLNLCLSVKALLNREFDYNKNLLALPGKKLLSIKHHWCTRRGHLTVSTAGTLLVFLSTRDSTGYTSLKRGQVAYRQQLSYFST